MKNRTNGYQFNNAKKFKSTYKDLPNDFKGKPPSIKNTTQLSTFEEENPHTTVR